MRVCARLLLLHAAIWLLAAPAFAQRTTDVSTAFVYVLDGTLHCNATPGSSLDAMAESLIRGGIQVHSQFESYDGREGIAICGEPTGGINVYEIAESDLPQAVELGYRRMNSSLSATFLRESVPARASLAVRVESSTREYGEPARFELSVILRNDGGEPVVVLPQSLRRQYLPLGTGAARYSPYPGPPIPPWKDAFVLRPGQSRTLALRGMRDGDGVWNLDPGNYALSIRFHVTSDAVEASSSHLKDLEAAIWQGDIQSSGIRIDYLPEPAS